jgi:hypothetical protein
MAKSADAIAKSIAEDIQAADPIIDVTKGPYYDSVIRPPSNELAVAAAEMERISTLYSRAADTSNSLTAAEIAALGRAFKVSVPVGKRATALIILYGTSKPAREVVIPAGSPIATTDGQLIFTTNQLLRGIDASNAASYYDANSGRYLYPVMATAVGEGEIYNLPAYRINRMLRTIEGISGAYNPVPSTGGVAPNSVASYLSMIQENFVSRDSGRFSGVATELQRRGITQSLLFVDSSERDAFFRPTTGAAADIYVTDAQEASEDETIAANGRTSLILTKQPVLAVESVYVNGVLLDSANWSVVVDTSPARVGSSVAQTKIMIPSGGLSDAVRVRYTYANSVQQIADSLEENDMMGADLLPRLAQPLYVQVYAEVNCPVDILADVKAAVLYYVTQPFMQLLDPADASSYVRKSFPEVKSLTWTRFDLRDSNSVRRLNVRSGLLPTFKTSTDLQVSIARR